LKSGPSIKPGRVFALLTALICLSGFGLAQSAVQGVRVSPASAKRRSLPPGGKLRPQDVSLARITPEALADWKAARAAAEARGVQPAQNEVQPPPTTPPFTDLTTVPRPPMVGASTSAVELHTHWTADQTEIYFASNNIDPANAGTFIVPNYGATPPPAGSRFHVYRMTSNGNVVTLVTGTTIPGEAGGEQLFPVTNPQKTKLAYVHRDRPQDPYHLYVFDFLTGQRTQLTGIDVPGSPNNIDLVDVQHPSWHPGGGFIAFAARLRTIANDVRNVYTVDITSGRLRLLTFGDPFNGVESFDPAFHPDENPAVPDDARIAFAANAQGVTVDMMGNRFISYGSPTPVTDHNLFIIQENGANTFQITTQTSDDIEPVFNRSDYPPGQGFGPFNNWLAFSSKGRLDRADIGTTYDIYFYDFPSAEAAAPANGPFEIPTRLPMRLSTPDSNVAGGPSNASDERYPAWSSGLPPQRPINQIAYYSNRQQRIVPDGMGGFMAVIVADFPMVQPNGSHAPEKNSPQLDIWVSEVQDVTPPTLLPFDEQRGEVLHIANQPLPFPGQPDLGRRVGVAGDTFFFYAKVQDRQFGVKSVWCQIKDPDLRSTDSQGQNHKLYGFGTFPAPGTPGVNVSNNVYLARTNGDNTAATHFLHEPLETDCEGIDVHNYTYYNGGPPRFETALFGATNYLSTSRYASYSPGVDDAVAFSGLNFPPPTSVPNGNPSFTGLWLQLNDSGLGEDRVAGDGIWSGAWRTPVDNPSDWYVDLVCYDNAFNPKDPSQVGNWIIFDNIWGFSTQPFSSLNPILLVDDNGSGQKWPRGINGAFRNFPTFRFGTESDILDRTDPANPADPFFPGIQNPYDPRQVRVSMPPTMPPSVSLFDVSDPSSQFTGLTNEVYPFLSGNAVPYDFISWTQGQNRGTLQAYRADIWRILARGPLPEIILNDFVPISVSQPRRTMSGALTSIQQSVARRVLVWHAPYTGDIFSGGGTILDQATHTLLLNFLNRAGRLVIAGGDIGFALTGDVPNTDHPFLAALGVRYQGDASANGSLTHPFVGGALGLDITHDVFRNFLPQPDPPFFWGPSFDPDPLGATDSFSIRTRHDTGGNGPNTAASDGTPFQVHDQVSVLPAPAGVNREMIYASGANGHVVFSEQPRTTANPTATDFKLAYFSMSLASMGRRYISQDDAMPLVCMNYRAKISHAMFCYMTSSDLVGRVTNIQGGAGVSGALVELIRGGNVIGAAVTDATGNYTIRGIPVGNYNLRVIAIGFQSFFKATGNSAHGLGQAQEDVLLTPASPGSITGTVRDQFGNPVPGTTLRATLQDPSGLFTGQREFFATTNVNGVYTFPNVLPADYLVEVVSLPAGGRFQNPQPPSRLVTVNPALPTTGVDFTLTAGPGPLTVRVFQIDQATGTRIDVVNGAEVNLVSGGAIIPGFTAITGPPNFSPGEVFFPSVPPGPVTVSVFKLGFQEGSANINIPQTSLVEIDLVPAPLNQEILGLAVRGIDGTPLTGADLAISVNLQLFRPLTGLGIGVQTPVFTPVMSRQVGPNLIQFNYDFVNIQGGRWIVGLKNHPRYFDATITVDATGTPPTVAPLLQLYGRPGALSGIVLDTSGNPIPNATVRIYSAILQPNTLVNAVQTAADGTWNSGPGMPSDIYTVEVQRFGFTPNPALVTGVFLAGNTGVNEDPRLRVILGRAPRGQVFGLVGNTIDGNPRGNVRIVFEPVNGSAADTVETRSFLPPTAVNSPDGLPYNYTIGAADPTGASPALAPGLYNVRVTGDPRFQDLFTQVNVPPGAAVRFDFNLVPLPGVLTGFVKENSPGNPPLVGALVQVIRNGVVQITLSTDATGRYQTPFAIAAGPYTVQASLFGYTTNSISVFVEGPTGPPSVADILLSRAPRGRVFGLVRNSLDQTPRGGVVIRFEPTFPGSGPQNAQTTQSFLPPTTANSPDGQPYNYTLGTADPTGAAVLLPPGTYNVRVINDPRFAAFSTQVTVPPGGSVRLDITLTPLPGTIFGFVKENSPARPPIPGATVRVIRNNITVATVTTAVDGSYITPQLAPGPYTLVASAFNYLDNSISVFIEGPVGPPAVADILLTRQPASTISGTVLSNFNNTPVAGATVALFLADGSPTGISTTTAANGTFTLTGVTAMPPGQPYLIQTSHPGFTQIPQSQALVQVNPGSNVTGLVLLLAPRQIFGTGLQLISMPETIPGDPADILGIPRAQLQMFAWNGGPGSQNAPPPPPGTGYTAYPTPPANRFDLGRGYFVRFPAATQFTKFGTPAPDQPFLLPLSAEWNLIGSVRRIPIEWLRVQVLTADGFTLTMQQAQASGIIQAGLWAFTEPSYFTTNVMEPFRGYFVRVLDARGCTLIIPVNNAPNGASAAAGKKKAAVPAAPTLVAALERGSAGTSMSWERQSVRASERETGSYVSTLLRSNALTMLVGLFRNLPEYWPWRGGSLG
jgi:carboxypeptidase family protein